MLERWQRAARGWSLRAEEVRAFGMPVSAWMIEQLRLQPGQRVLELAAGPGDTGFMAAELVESRRHAALDRRRRADARDRARASAEAGHRERRVQARSISQWIDLDAASVDAALCRWGLMFAADPGAALPGAAPRAEARRAGRAGRVG